MLVREQGSGESRASPSPLMQVTQLVHRLFQLLMQRREQNSEIERLGEVPVHARFFGLRTSSTNALAVMAKIGSAS